METCIRSCSKLSSRSSVLLPEIKAEGAYPASPLAAQENRLNNEILAELCSTLQILSCRAQTCGRLVSVIHPASSTVITSIL